MSLSATGLREQAPQRSLRRTLAGGACMLSHAFPHWRSYGETTDLHSRAGTLWFNLSHSVGVPCCPRAELRALSKWIHAPKLALAWRPVFSLGDSMVLRGALASRKANLGNVLAASEGKAIVKPCGLSIWQSSA